MNRREKGVRGEERALAFLTRKGYTVIERNFRSRRGEIDIIALQNERIVFTEVKVVGAYPPEDAGLIIGPRKKQRIRETGREYLGQHPEMNGVGVRFDVVLVYWGRNEIVHLENAF